MTALFALAPAAWADLLRIVRRRWWIAVAAAAIVGAAAASVRGGAGADLTVNLIGFVCALGTWLAAYAETMVIDVPGYRLTFARAARVAGIGLIVLLSIVLAWVIVAIPAIAAGQRWLPLVWLFIVIAAIGTKTAFAFYRLDDPDGAFASSWRLSSGRSFLPTLTLVVLDLICAIVLSVAVERAPGGPAGIAGATAYQILVFLVYAFFTPWTLRWMHAGEASRA